MSNPNQKELHRPLRRRRDSNDRSKKDQPQRGNTIGAPGYPAERPEDHQNFRRRRVITTIFHQQYSNYLTPQIRFGRVELVQSKKSKNKVFALKYLKKIDIVYQGQQEHVYNEKTIQMNCRSPFIVRLYRTYKDNK